MSGRGLTRIGTTALALLTGLLLFLGSTAQAQNPVRVFAAASLTQPLTALLADAPSAEGARRTEGVYASSGTLTRQIEAGAPADIFISAHPRWSDYLIEKRVVAADQVSAYLGNRLIVVTSNSTAHPIAFSPDILDRFLSDRLAIGDPAHVPAGQYAQQSLQFLGIWKELQSSAVRAANVRAVITYVRQGAVGYGIVYHSDAVSENGLKTVAQIPEDSHDPIRYTITLLSDRPEVRQVYNYLVGRKSLRLLSGMGFIPLEGE